MQRVHEQIQSQCDQEISGETELFLKHRVIIEQTQENSENTAE